MLNITEMDQRLSYMTSRLHHALSVIQEEKSRNINLKEKYNLQQATLQQKLQVSKQEMTLDKQKALALTNDQAKKLQDMNKVLQTVNKIIKDLQIHEKNIQDCQASFFSQMRDELCNILRKNKGCIKSLERKLEIIKETTQKKMSQNDMVWKQKFNQFQKECNIEKQASLESMRIIVDETQHKAIIEKENLCKKLDEMNYCTSKEKENFNIINTKLRNELLQLNKIIQKEKLINQIRNKFLEKELANNTIIVREQAMTVNDLKVKLLSSQTHEELLIDQMNDKNIHVEQLEGVITHLNSNMFELKENAHMNQEEIDSLQEKIRLKLEKLSSDYSRSFVTKELEHDNKFKVLVIETKKKLVQQQEIIAQSHSEEIRNIKNELYVEIDCYRIQLEDMITNHNEENKRFMTEKILFIKNLTLEHQKDILTCKELSEIKVSENVKIVTNKSTAQINNIKQKHAQDFILLEEKIKSKYVTEMEKNTRLWERNRRNFKTTIEIKEGELRNLMNNCRLAESNVIKQREFISILELKVCL